MSSKHSLQLPMLGLLLALTAGGASAEVVAIISAKNATAALSGEQVSDIFLGKTSTFPGGATAVPLDQAENSPQREEFYNKLVHKSATQMKSYWSRIIFSSKGEPPRNLPDSKEIRKAVANDPNAIGYIDKSSVDASVKVVFIP
ncbi:phosphate ABC transporter substrate-binding protein [Pseudoduganella sp. LjRoot289]|uniref:phosphate ABC transporter substrate-binding protein n=1 Tax=Pseudoduganella sp. LjRoot289 TaxID=3342314 RepID=UPI003ED12025